MRRRLLFRITLLLVCTACTHGAKAQADTLHIMAYNVLYYGETPSCQGAHSIYHNYLKTIVAYTNPDIITLEKMGAIPVSVSDPDANAPMGFADSVVQFALNAAGTITYAYCPFTNTAGADNMSVLFYNIAKLGYISRIASYPYTTDFNTYKLYYKDTNLATIHDTAFLYITPTHDQSGDDPTTRNAQIAGEQLQLRGMFTHFPNMLNMGDFNTRSTTENCYQQLVTPADTSYRFYEAPFYPDANFSYPADWDANANPYTAFLTTSTREDNNIGPNDCGTDGGAKAWYDHIFLSANIINNADHIRYIPHSYRTIGNDGHRLGISANDNSPIVNSSAPTAVVEAIFQMSNKYPIMVDLAISPATDTVIPNSVTTVAKHSAVTITNPVSDKLLLHLSNELIGQQLTVECFDPLGRVALQQSFTATTTIREITNNLRPGTYHVRVVGKKGVVLEMTVVKL